MSKDRKRAVKRREKRKREGRSRELRERAKLKSGVLNKKDRNGKRRKKREKIGRKEKKGKEDIEKNTNGEDKERVGQKEIWKMASWNMVGLRNKYKDLKKHGKEIFNGIYENVSKPKFIFKIKTSTLRCH